jgi:biotin transport system permease protein
MTLGVYVPGGSRLHRASAGIKIFALAVYAVAISLTDNAYELSAFVAMLLVAWAVSGVPWGKVVRALKPAVWLLLMLFIFQLVVTSFDAASDVLVTLMSLIIAAALISHTTRTDDMLEALKKAFGLFTKFGVNAQACAFAIVFTIRLVPFIAAVGRDAIDARIARGAGRNPLPALVPMIIRLMRETDTLSEAVVARGFGRA